MCEDIGDAEEETLVEHPVPIQQTSHYMYESDMVEGDVSGTSFSDKGENIKPC